MRSRHEENVLKNTLIALAVIVLTAPEQLRSSVLVQLHFAVLRAQMNTLSSRRLLELTDET